MQVRTDSKNGSLVASPSDTIEAFQAHTQRRVEQWIQQLQEAPDVFTDIEQQIDQHYRQGGGRLVASLLTRATEDPQMDEQVEQVRQEAVIPLRAPRPRTLKVRLLCGLILWITTSYCAPRRRRDADPGEQLAGLYPELAAFGFGKGCSPALQYKVARIVALSPSIDVARKELRREGIVLDKKTVRRIAEQLGYQLLELRRRELFAWREGWLPAGHEFAGRRVAVQIDGGRVRLRENKKRKKNSKKKKGTRQKFDTPWREPKALIIFEFNEHGRMVKKDRQPLIDGTLLGPDHLAELVAFHLHRLGVAQAELVVFISDGARWIWDRLDWIERRAGLDSSKTMHVLDFCHAAHHISLALAALGLTGDARRRTYVYLRKLLRQSRYDEVVAELKKRAKRKKLKAKHEVWTEIRYLQKHGAEGHLRYVTFRRRGIPCGSGAIESTIRRVINQRLKSNAMYWLEENAEAMFAVRALLLCDRWEETLGRVRQTMARDRRIDWQWSALDLTKLKADESISPPSPKTQEKQQHHALVL
jgi:hypothetical protein